MQGERDAGARELGSSLAADVAARADTQAARDASPAQDRANEVSRDAHTDALANAGESNSLAYVGCSMARNVAEGYRDAGGTRLWPPYKTGGAVAQEWTEPNAGRWRAFDEQAAKHGRPRAIWVQLCVYGSRGVKYDEVTAILANARAKAQPGATIYVSGQPLYEAGWTCSLAGAAGPALTDTMAKRAGDDPALGVTYVGPFGPLGKATTQDGCHANAAGLAILGEQAVRIFGK
jgi:hypothetical protein